VPEVELKMKPALQVVLGQLNNKCPTRTKKYICAGEDELEKGLNCLPGRKGEINRIYQKKRVR
jgi:hypothetical protein